MVDDHPGEARPYLMNQIADSLLIDRAEIQAVLATGTHKELLAHLTSYTQEELRPLRIRRGAVTAKPFPWASKRKKTPPHSN